MKNIVKVNRFNGPQARLYALPDDITIKAGTIVKVEAPTTDATAIGVTVSDSYLVDGDTEAMVIDLLHFLPPTLDNMKRVLSIYSEVPVDQLYNATLATDPAPAAEDGEETEE